MTMENLAINTIRTLSMDGVQAANSGHPGTPMSLAPAAYLIYNEAMRYDPAQPTWLGRDRFVLSCGHASMLLYSMLHLTGVQQTDGNGKPSGELAVTLDDIKNFRQLDSRCPGHPEYGHTSGVETTTGPLGQGIATSVGMAIGTKWLGKTYNRDGYDLFDGDIYVLCGDGDMMEGVGCEAASMAGHLKLSNLCWIYDDNKITIEGSTDLAFSEDVGMRFEAYGWNVVKVADINDLPAMRAAIDTFKATDDRPTLIIVKTVIGYGAPNLAGTHTAHGAPLGDEEIRLTKEGYGWPADEKFLVPDGVREHFAEGVGTRGAAASAAWTEMFEKYRAAFPAEAAQIDKIAAGELPVGWDAAMEAFPADEKGIASRASSGKVLNQVAKELPWMIGGSADLSPSNKSDLSGEASFLADNYGGRNLHYGIRENAMGSICNGIALTGLKTYCATFFVFTDYMRPAMRLAALMELPVFYILTHDSIGVGEDGPTHQPVEHLAAARSIPGMMVFRPGDANEVSQAYRTVMGLKKNPACLILTRQNLPTLDLSVEGAARGGYVIADADGTPDVILIATGSEVSLCLEAKKVLDADGVKTRVVSMPCMELFDAQDEAYQQSVLPDSVTRRVGVEMGIEQGWRKYIGRCGRFVGMEGFGASAPAGVLAKHFGFTVENVVAQAKAAGK